jgi:anti-sigma regulatory factor (Ser/Thr protein kinase)
MMDFHSRLKILKKLRKLKIFLILCLGLYPFSSEAQEHPYYYNISTEDGLPSNEVYELLQDSFGYVWIGCDAGLFRYDGFEFRQYKTIESKGRSMSFLTLDKEGSIWCQNFAGQIFKVVGDSLQLMVAHEEECGFGMRYNQSPDGKVWVGCGPNLEVYNLEGEQLKEQSFNTQTYFDDGKQKWIGGLCWHEGDLYLTLGRAGIYRYNESKASLEMMKIDELPTGGPTRISSLHGYLWGGYANASTNWKGKGGYLLQLAEDSIYLRHKIEQNFSINKLGKGKSNENFFVGDFGVYYTELSAPSDSFMIKEHLFPNTRISDVLLDREGNYWFSSLDYGIYVVPSLEIKRFKAEQTKGAKRLFLDLNNRLWVGGSKGELYYLDEERRKYQIVKDGEYFPGAVKNIRLGEPDVLYVTGYGNIQIDLNSLEVIGSKNGSSRDVLVYRDHIYTASSAGFFQIKKETYFGKSVTSFKKRVSTWNLEVDSLDQSVWATLSSGLEYYKNGKLEPVLYNGKAVYGKVLDYEEGLMWVGSVNQGIYGFEKGKLKHHFSTKDGLLSDEIKTLKVQGDWVFATAGSELYRIHIPTKKIEYFSKHLGIIAQDVEDLEIRDNRLYLATNKGLFSLPIDHSAFNEVPPNIQIEGLMLGDSVLKLENGLIQLPYRHTTFRISFSSTAFRSRGDFYYEYRIPELDENWIQLNAENNYVSFSALSAGNFHFEVRAVNENGVKSELPASLAFSVRSPIWQRWWFYLLMSVLFIGIVLIISWLRWRIVAKRLALEQQLSRSQLIALKAQMNPHFLYNALNSIQELMLTQDLRNANRYLNKFSNLMRRILNGSNHDEIILAEEIELLSLYLDLEKLRFGAEFNYEISIDPEIDEERQEIVSMVIQPFAENAVKHGLLHKKGAKQLFIRFEKEEEHLKCIVEDNGIGRQKAAEIKARANRNKSFATEATAKRLEILNAYYENKIIGLEVIDLVDKKGQPSGTRVVLRLPITIQRS